METTDVIADATPLERSASATMIAGAMTARTTEYSAIVCPSALCQFSLSRRVLTGRIVLLERLFRYPLLERGCGNLFGART